MGGSIAGLLAARVLADAYREVLVVDRDQVLGVTETRRGVPQGAHAHGLLARGHQIIEELLPGFTDEVKAAGALTGDLGELRWFFHGRRLQPAHTGLIAVAATRPMLESLIRDRVAQLPNVTLLERREAIGLLATADRSRVIGVRLLDTREGTTEEDLDADLVVDATGRGSRTPVRLAEFGYARPAEERVKINLTYTTRYYRPRSSDALHGDQSVNPVSSPSHPRGAFFSELENGLHILSLTGVLGDRAPTTPEGFLDFVKSLPVPDVYDVIKDAEPLTDPVSFHYPASIRRHYERLRQFPDRLLVVGDAVCSFNPVYGQGMTVAALEALTLRDHLSQGAVPRPLPFLRDIAKVIDVPWDISAGGDLGFPGAEGRRTLKIRMGNAYMARLQAAATCDGEVTRAFMRVAGLIDPPENLMHPRMIRRVLAGAARAKRAAQAGRAS